MKKRTVPGPRPPLLVVVAGLVLLVPAILVLVLCVVCFLYLLIVPEPDAEGQYAVLIGFGILSVPSAWTVWALFRAFWREDSRAARALSIICLLMTLLSVPGWIVGLLNLTGVLHDPHDWGSWWELAIYSLIVLAFAFLGYEMWRWEQILKTAKPIPMMDDLSEEF